MYKVCNAAGNTSTVETKCHTTPKTFPKSLITQNGISKFLNFNTVVRMKYFIAEASSISRARIFGKQ